jgi:hypothetical protein
MIVITRARSFLGSSGDEFEEVATAADLDGPIGDPRSMKPPSQRFCHLLKVFPNAYVLQHVSNIKYVSPKYPPVSLLMKTNDV